MVKIVQNLTHDRLELIDEQYPKYKPIYVDFSSGRLAYRWQQGMSMREPLARALGIKNTLYPRVIDATAGLGSDAFILACLGCQVTLIERSPMIASLLADGLRRAASDAKLAPIVARLQLQHADSIAYLTNLTTLTKPEVIYLDPMYPPSSKSALVKKEMRLLRAAVGDNHDSADLFAAARQAANSRVVVKRHRFAATITALKATYVIYTQVVRFDIYLR